MFQETAEGKEKVTDAPDKSHCVDLNCNEDSEGNSQNSQKMTTSDMLQNLGLEGFPEAFHAPSIKKSQSLEPMGKLRNVHLLDLCYIINGQ